MKKSNFDIFIPVGGIGRRLGGITINTPKPLIKINKEEFIITVIKSLMKTKIKNVNLLTSYKDQKFNFLIKKFEKKKIKIKLIKDNERIGTFNCLNKCKHNINHDFIYSNADEIVNINIKRLITIFYKNNLDVLQLIFNGEKEGLPLDSKYIINKKKFQTGKKYIEGGLKILNKKIFNKLKIKKFKKIEDCLFFNRDSINLKYYIIDEKPYSIDTWKRIKRTKKFLMKTKF
mgnify:CR=1 FL=1